MKEKKCFKKLGNYGFMGWIDDSTHEGKKKVAEVKRLLRKLQIVVRAIPENDLEAYMRDCTIELLARRIEELTTE